MTSRKEDYDPSTTIEKLEQILKGIETNNNTLLQMSNNVCNIVDKNQQQIKELQDILRRM